METKEIQNIVRAIIQASKTPVHLEELCKAFKNEKQLESIHIQEALEALLKAKDPVQELKRVAGGYRYQIRQKYIAWVRKTQEPEIEAEPFPTAYSEVLAIIAYKQPISRGEIEDIRAKQTSAAVFEELIERQWIRVVDYGGESGRAMLYGTTNEFLEYFGLNSIHDLPEVETLTNTFE